MTNKTLYLCLLVVGFCLTAACMAVDPNAPSAPEVAQFLATALSDNTLTQAELDEFQALLEQYGSTRSAIDWKALAGTAVAGVLTTLTGIRFLPNSLIVGKQEADAINKAAGIG
jgi:hypothetical protein